MYAPNVCQMCNLHLYIFSTGNDQITDLSFKLISKCCPYIRLIHIACCQMNDVGLKMVSQPKCIHVLSVADCLWYYITPIFL